MQKQVCKKNIVYSIVNMAFIQDAKRRYMLSVRHLLVTRGTLCPSTSTATDKFFTVCSRNAMELSGQFTSYEVILVYHESEIGQSSQSRNHIDSNHTVEPYYYNHFNTFFNMCRSAGHFSAEALCLR